MPPLPRADYDPAARGTLAGVRVLDLSRLVAGNTLGDAIGLLHGAGIFASLAGGADDRSLIDWVYRNVHGSAVPATSVDGLLASIDTLGQAGFLREFASSPAAEAGIGLVGLRANGLEYL